VVVITDHRVFDWAWIVSKSHLIVDTRNVTAALRGDGRKNGASKMNGGSRIVRL